MKLEITNNQKPFKKELTLGDKIRNIFNFHSLKKQLKEVKEVVSDEKEFKETLLIDEILEED